MVSEDGDTALFLEEQPSNRCEKFHEVGVHKRLGTNEAGHFYHSDLAGAMVSKWIKK